MTEAAQTKQSGHRRRRRRRPTAERRLRCRRQPSPRYQRQHSRRPQRPLPSSAPVQAHPVRPVVAGRVRAPGAVRERRRQRAADRPRGAGRPGLPVAVSARVEPAASPTARARYRRPAASPCSSRGSGCCWPALPVDGFGAGNHPQLRDQERRTCGVGTIAPVGRGGEVDREALIRADLTAANQRTEKIGRLVGSGSEWRDRPGHSWASRPGRSPSGREYT